MPSFFPVLRPAAALPVEPRFRLRRFAKDTALSACHRGLELLAKLDRRAALWTAEVLRRTLLARWVDLAPWKISAGGATFDLLEERNWVRSIREPIHWSEMTGVDREGRYEAAFLDAFESYARQARVIVDAGAARGLYSVIGVRAAGSREVHAFEPNPARRLALLLNVLRLCGGKRVVIRPEFLSAEDVRGSITLDSYCQRLNLTPDLIKIDVEGAEIELLEGAREVCRRARPILLIEFHQRRMRGQGKDPGRLVSLLEEYGYRAEFNGHHGALEVGGRNADHAWRLEPPNPNLTAVLATPISNPRR